MRNLGQRLATFLQSAVLLAGLFGASAVSAAPMDHQEMTPSAPTVNCQQSCGVATSSPTAGSLKEVEQETDKKTGYIYPLITPSYDYDSVNRLTHNPSQDARLLRPPDLNILHSLLRF